MNKRSVTNSNSRSQMGGTLMMVIFVILVMSMFGITLIQLQWSNQDNHARTQLGTRAWFMAHSANELALTKLYPLGKDETPSLVKQRCEDINSQWNSDADLGTLASLSFCQIKTMSCQYSEADAGYEAFQTYTLETTAQCGEDEYLVERSQTVITKGIE